MPKTKSKLSWLSSDSPTLPSNPESFKVISERKLIFNHALTVWVGQIAVMSFGITDTVVAGRYSEHALATLSIGSAFYITVFVALMGVLQALLPALSELRGAGKAHALGVTFRQSLYLCIATSIIGVIALLTPNLIFEHTQVPQTLRVEAQSYLEILAVALPPALFFRLFSTLNQSLGRPQLVTWVQIAALCVKIPLSVLFTFGTLGVEGLGVTGCALATLVVNYLMMILALILLKTQALYRPYKVWAQMERIDWREISALAKLGVPNALSITVEVTSFTLMAFFIARLGTQASASHQIVANFAALMYMVPLSLSIATSARVSYWIGASKRESSHKAIKIGFQNVIAMACINIFLLALFRDKIAELYSPNPEVAVLAGSMLAWLCLYHIGDSLQVLCFFILRCYKITLKPLLIYSVMLWGVGLLGGFSLAYKGVGSVPAMMSPQAFWIASSTALGLSALLLIALVVQAQKNYSRFSKRDHL
jgi:MATE family multidrug resistance protein